MGFFLFILLLFIFLFWPVIKTAWRVRNARNSFRDLADRMRREAGASSAGSQRQQQYPRPRKVYSREEGEYVEFEEVDASETTVGNDGSYRHTEVHEQQVSDAEWEEIK